MKPVADSRWFLLAIPVLVAALGLAGCAQPRYIPPPLPSTPTAPAPQPQVSRPVFYVKVNRLNLRACPGMDCPKISQIDRDEEVEQVGASEDWVQIRVKRDGRLGWVDSRYLSPTPVSAPEAAPPAPPMETAPPSTAPETVQPPGLPERIQPPPLPERQATPPVEKFKPVKPEEALPPARQKPEEAKPAKPAKAKPEETGEAAPPEKKPAPKKEKPAPKEEKPAPAPEETPETGKKIRIM